MKKNVFLLFFSFFIFTFSSSLETDSKNIAIISNGGYVSENSVSVKRSKYLLKRFSEFFKITTTQVADMTTYASMRLLEEKGIQITPLQILEEINKGLYSYPKGLKYNELVAMYILVSQ